MFSAKLPREVEHYRIGNSRLNKLQKNSMNIPKVELALAGPVPMKVCDKV